MKKSLLTLAQLLPVILSLLLIAAHFSRAGDTLLMSISFVVLFSLFVPRAWIARIAQAALALAALEWILTIYQLISARMDAGQSWQRLAIILGIVVVFTLASIFSFQARNLKERYGLNKQA
ncbi:MAG: hypothetical protein DWQ05_17135 [Calditrichaeota bacterium]|nr:MAG: hypothetical protein DWQ05_17135 [Calditrichota bacterium]